MENKEIKNSIYIFRTPQKDVCIDLRKIVSVEYTESKTMIVRMISQLSDFEIPNASKSSYEEFLSIWAKWAN